MSPRFSLPEVLLRTQTDARLCGLAADGHPRAFALLVERHRLPMLRTAARIVGRQQAEDVVQEALLRAWRALGGGTEVAQVQGWLHQIVRHTAINHLARERAAESPLPDDLPDPQGTGATVEERLRARALLEQIAMLPERQRTALAATEFAGRSRREIADDLGLSEGAVRQLVHRARHAVRVAVTAVTPYPLAAWMMSRSGGPGPIGRVAELVPPGSSPRPGLLESLAAGSTAGGGVLLKGGAVVIAAGALGGGVAWRALSGPSSPPRARGSAVADAPRADGPAGQRADRAPAGTLPSLLLAGGPGGPLRTVPVTISTAARLRYVTAAGGSAAGARGARSGEAERWPAASPSSDGAGMAARSEASDRPGGGSPDTGGGSSETGGGSSETGGGSPGTTGEGTAGTTSSGADGSTPSAGGSAGATGDSSAGTSAAGTTATVTESPDQAAGTTTAASTTASSTTASSTGAGTPASTGDPTPTSSTSGGD